MGIRHYISRFKNIFVLSCREATELLSRAQDSKLRLLQRVRLRWHLSICDSCTRFSQQLPLLRQALRFHTHRDEQDPSQPLPQDVREELQKKINKLL